ncbi:MAG TPA: FUSC family protein [Candidatus Eisenbacteria bacterium]|nr:FUSC family protein [Candidatus Eisenbacteria bacterium]
MVFPQALSRTVRGAVKPPRDPGFGALRRAARAAIVIPPVFAFADVLLGEPESLIFVMFGCFSLLVISDFGGLRRPRALAYLSATVAGAALVVLGTLASSSAWLAVATMFVVGFAISFSRVFGGYVAAANTGLLLAFVIAVTIPAPAAVIPLRVGGWAIAGMVSTLAAVAFWPRFERVTMHHKTARALLAIADVVHGLGSGAGSDNLEKLKNNAAEAVLAARQGFIDMARRPTATARGDRAFAELLIEIDRILEIIERPFNLERPTVRPGFSETDQLVAAVVAALRSSAGVLKGGAPPDVDAIEAARQGHRAALDRWASEQLRAGRPAEEVLDGLDFDDTVRVVSYVALVLGRNAVIAAGGRPDLRDTAVHVVRTLRAHLESPSTVLQGALRVAIGLALAVWVARAFDLSHAFWVVLGTIQVLRSNALSTGRSVIQAVAGNAIGVLVGGLFAVIAGNHPALMWTALPIAVFFAAYAATTIGFMASQAAFTINLIIVFNLISPAGWQVGLVRLEDLLVGTLISLVVGLLLWPSGARREFGRAVASAYQVLIGYLDKGFDRVLGFEPPTSSTDSAQQGVVRVRDRVDAAFDTLMTDRVGGSFDRETAAFLLSTTNHMSLAGDLLNVIAGPMGYQGGSCADGGLEVRDQAHTVLGEYRRLAERLSLAPSAQSESQVSLAALRQAALKCLRRWQTNPELGRSAMAVVMAAEWVQYLARLEVDLEEPVSRASEAARKPWWR